MTRRFAGQVAEIVELRATDTAAIGDVDLLDTGGVRREAALDADTVAFLAHGEGLIETTMLPRDTHALERLDALFGPLTYEIEDFNGVARGERGHVSPELRLFEFFNYIRHLRLHGMPEAFIERPLM